MKQILYLLLVLLAAFMPLPARTDDGGQRERVDLDEAVRKGEVMPLSDILKKVKPKLQGQILEIEFEYEKGLPIYEIYVLNSLGRRLEYEIDARTAEILSHEDDD